MEEYKNCMYFSATSVEPEWDPHDTSFSCQEDTILTTVGFLRDRPEEFRRRFVARMHSNPFNCIQELGNRNLENILITHIIVSSVGGQASNWM